MISYYIILTTLQIVSAIAIIALVLLQHGKGADMGAAFGSGASGSLFGATGASNFLSRITAIAAVIFFVSTLLLAFTASNRSGTNGILDGYTPSQNASTPAAGTDNSTPAAPKTTPQ